VLLVRLLDAMRKLDAEMMLLPSNISKQDHHGTVSKSKREKKSRRGKEQKRKRSV